MKQRELITMMVFAFFIVSIVSTIVLTWKVNDVILSGEAVGNVSLDISNPCGNDVCGANENCPVDAGFCDDNKCYEPTCTNGCGETAVADGSTDEACTGSTGCVGGNCQCDGAGGCSSGGASAPSPGGGVGGGGPSGGGRIPTESRGIDVSEDRIKSVVKVGELLKQRVTLSNLGSKSTQVSVEVIGLEDIVTILNPVFILSGKDAQTVAFDILSDIPGVYTGQLIVRAGGRVITIPLTVEVETKQVLFDLSLDVKPKILMPGEEITGHVTLFNINEIGLVNVDINYFIKGLENNLILEGSEVISIETQATFSKTFEIPEDLEFGEYVFIVQSSYEGTVGTSSENFQVGRIEEPRATSNKFVLGMVIVIFILIVVFGYTVHRRLSKVSNMERKRVGKLKINKKKIVKNTLKKQVLFKKQESLEKAYKSGYIKEGAYKEGQRDIRKAMKKLR